MDDNFALEMIKQVFNPNIYSMRTIVTNKRQSGNGAKTILRVFFPNEGVTICERFAADTLKSVIAMIGIQRVADACRRDIDSVLNMNNVPLVARFKDKCYANRQHEIGGGWYVFTGTNTQVKKRQLEMLKEIYGLNMQVAIV